MRKRSTEILQIVIKDKSKSVCEKDLTARYHITQKTLRNDIKEINNFLYSISASELVFTGKGEIVCTEGFDESLVEQHLYEMDLYTYKLSTRERRIYIMMLLATGAHYTTMQSIAEELYVSRITIVNDIDAIKEEYRKYGAELMIDPGKGMLLKCTRKEKAEILAALYKEVGIDRQNNGVFQRIVLNRMQVQLGFQEIFSCLQEYMQIRSVVFAEDIFYEIVLYVFVVFNFCREAGSWAISGESQSELESMLLHVGHEMKVTITQAMLEDFRQYIQKYKLDSFVKTLDEVELYKVIMRFLQKVEKRTHYELTDDQHLMDSLLMHIRHMKNWGDWQVEFPKEYESYIDYAFLEQMVNECAPILEQFLGYELSSNMKKSIVIHICVSIIQNQRYMSRVSVIIVCPGSMATGQYLKAQIKNYFNFKILDVLAVKDVNQKLKQMTEPVDYIISTVNVQTEYCPVIRVHPFLKIDDMNLIRKMTFQKQKSVLSSMPQKLNMMKSMIQDMIEDTALVELICEKISEVIEDYQSDLPIWRKNAIGELLEPGGIQITEEELSWKQAMYRASEPLERAGYLQKTYIEKAIRNVEEYGDYIVVSDGVALAHADKNSGVAEDCLGLLVLKKGTCFSETSGKVYLLFCFATTSENKHLDILKEIIQMGKKEGRVQRLCALETLKEIYEEIIYGR